MIILCSKCGDATEIPDELIGDHTEEDITGYLCEACDPDCQMFDDIPFWEHPAYLGDDLEDDCEDDPRRNGAIELLNDCDTIGRRND